MSFVLDQIIQTKEKEVEKLLEKEKNDPKLQLILEHKTPFSANRLQNALKVAGLSVIAEIKRKSPSKGHLSAIPDPVKLAHAYSQAGAAAISILTDTDYFGGSLDDLALVAKDLNLLHPPPLLRKDFIIHPLQIAESKKKGASAILLIVRVLKRRLLLFLEAAHRIGLDCLVEVHNEEELQMAIDAGSKIIGVNHRDLQTFEMDLKLSEKLLPKIPKGVVKVAESGLLNLADIKKMHDLGADGVLIGEMLVQSNDPRSLISEIGNL